MKPTPPAPSFTATVYPSESEWLEARRQSTGSSGIMNILGVPTDGREPAGLWWEWVRSNPNAWEGIGESGRSRYREIQAKGLEHLNLAARRAMEPVIEEWANERLEGGVIVDPGPFTIFRSTADPRKHCSPDGLVIAARPTTEEARAFARQNNLTLSAGRRKLTTQNPRAVTEYKTISPFARHHWSPHDPSEYAVYQANWAMLVSGLPTCYVAGQVGYGDHPERDRLFYELERHDELCSLLEEQHARFWDYVDRDIPPPVDGFEKTTAAIRLFYKAEKKGSGRIATLPPAGGWVHPETQELVPWVQVEKARQTTRQQIEELQRKELMLRQALEAEAGRLQAETLVIPPTDEKGNLVLQEERKYSRTEVTRKPRLCPHCKEQIQKGTTYTRFQ